MTTIRIILLAILTASFVAVLVYFVKQSKASKANFSGQLNGNPNSNAGQNPLPSTPQMPPFLPSYPTPPQTNTPPPRTTNTPPPAPPVAAVSSQQWKLDLAWKALMTTVQPEISDYRCEVANNLAVISQAERGEIIDIYFDKYKQRLTEAIESWKDMGGCNFWSFGCKHCDKNEFITRYMQF
jgi:hypothetical protein